MERPETVKSSHWIGWFLLLTVFPNCNVQGMDSTSVVGANAIPIPSVNSILGSAENNKLCSYKSNDKKIHCLSNLEDKKEYKVSAIRSPTFPRFQARKIGSINVQNNSMYGFISPITYKRVGQDTIACKLALAFKQTGMAVVWIWFDEIRFDGRNHRAFLDTNGDSLIDRTLVGQWNGNLYGSKKWWTPDPFDGKYSTEEREFTNRPEFGTFKGKARGCGVESVKVATLVAIN